MNGLSLFSGIGGLDVALSEWVRPIAYCEIEPYCQGVLLSRMAAGLLEYAPIWDDIRTFRPFSYCEIIYAGFPCQDISIAGHGKGLAGERSGLFYEIIRILRETRPGFLFLENVPAITTRGGVEVVKEITALGYDCRWCIISASEIGAVHRRQRFFLLAHSNSKPSSQTNQETQSKQIEEETRLRSTRQNWRNVPFVRWDEGECPCLAMDDGFPFELEQSRALGNAVVPTQARKAFKTLIGIK